MFLSLDLQGAIIFSSINLFTVSSQFLSTHLSTFVSLTRFFTFPKACTAALEFFKFTLQSILPSSLKVGFVLHF